MSEKSQLLELVERVQEWHSARLAAARDIQALAKEGASVAVVDGSGQEVKVQLTQREAMIFSMGMDAGIAHFEKLPFTVSAISQDEEDEGDEEF